MPSPLRMSARARKATELVKPFDKKARRATKQGMYAGYTFKGSGRSAAYRGAAGVALRAGKGALEGHRAGLRAEQSYTG